MIHNLSLYTPSPISKIDTFYHSLSYTEHTNPVIYGKSGDAGEMSPKTHINGQACKMTLCSLN